MPRPDVRMALALAVTALLTLPPRSAGAQDGCEFGDQGNDVLRQVTMPGGEAIFYITRPHFVCEGGIQIWADSATAFTSTNIAHLLGSVRYRDPSRSLTADEARYFSNVGRLQAEGRLRVEDLDEGSVIENGALVYLRQTSFRPEESMTVTVAADRVRPRATLRAAADSTTSARTYVVVGDEIRSRGGTYLRSTGSVELSFDSIQAFSDTLEFEEETDRLDLLGRARVDAPEYQLVGDRIQLFTPEAGQREIRATRDAELTGDNLVLTAGRIFLFARDDRMERLVALPVPRPDSVTEMPLEGRPVALADEFEVSADSLEIRAPDERLERVFASGRARSVTTGRDSLTVPELPAVARTDWLEGDTIVITFVPAREAVAEAMAPATDTMPEIGMPTDPSESAGPEPGTVVDRIVAIVSARSLYRLPPSDRSARPGVDPPAIHYVVGDRITIVMLDGEVERMEVEGETRGVHLEPLRPGGGP